MRENEDLDLLLDSAVKTYAESETSPNLEQRILALEEQMKQANQRT